MRCWTELRALLWESSGQNIPSQADWRLNDEDSCLLSDDNCQLEAKTNSKTQTADPRDCTRMISPDEFLTARW
jgi:hypothetical protein